MKNKQLGFIFALLLAAVFAGSLGLSKGQIDQAKTIQSKLIKTTSKPIQNTPKKTIKPLENIGTFKLTAYCPCRECSGGYGRQTATGKKARAKHTIAVDPEIIPYGTKLWINGQKYVAEDCGAAVKGNVIDIFFDTHDEVDAFGVQYATVYME